MNRPQLCFVSDFSGTTMARFSEDIAARLQALAWWDWPHQRLRAALPDFRALSVEAFLERHESSLELGSAQSTAVA
jgi:hypothetical protein